MYKLNLLILPESGTRQHMPGPWTFYTVKWAANLHRQAQLITLWKRYSQTFGKKSIGPAVRTELIILQQWCDQEEEEEEILVEGKQSKNRPICLLITVKNRRNK